MTRLIVMLVCPLIAYGQTQVLPRASPMLVDGVISVVENGHRVALPAGNKCTDLWIAPDESAIAFVDMTSQEESLIVTTRVYLALKAQHFRPVSIALRPVRIDGRLWRLFRNPRISSDLKSVFINIPYTSTTSKIVRFSLTTGKQEILGDATDYCVVWGGRHRNEMVTQFRYIPNDPAKGVVYECKVRDSTGKETKIGADCEDFEEFAMKWALDSGGSCR